MRVSQGVRPIDDDYSRSAWTAFKGIKHLPELQPVLNGCQPVTRCGRRSLKSLNVGVVSTNSIEGVP